MSDEERLHEAELILEVVLDETASREYLKGLTTTYFSIKKMQEVILGVLEDAEGNGTMDFSFSVQTGDEVQS